MTRKEKIFSLLVLFCVIAGTFAQKQSTIVLDEAVLTDAKLKAFAHGVKVKKVKDTLTEKNSVSLTDALRFNTPIYFKENGYGMVSSPSFRGTTASQTAVIWNGIPVNSQLNGQTDFNTINSENYDEILVRSGGGSVQYGSGAIGGSIHLNDEQKFNQSLKNELLLSYGSFNTQKVNYTSSYGTKKWTFGLGVNYNASDNDYKYLGTDQKNKNGEFSNYNVNANLAHFIGENHLLKLFHNTYFGDRNFSGTLTAITNNNYKSITSRSLLEWNHFSAGFSGKLKVAYLYEKYKFFINKDRSEFSFGKAKNTILNYDFKYYLGDIKLNAIVEYNYTKGEGSSIVIDERIITSGTVLISHEISNKISYDVSLRQDFVKTYDSPFLFAATGKYNLTKFYTTTLNASRNYRMPTFNDLFWNPGGNLNLLPESSIQGEWGHILKKPNYQLQVAGYYISSKNLIQWRPPKIDDVETPKLDGVWTPRNVDSSRQYGGEFEFIFSQKFGKHFFDWSGVYAYTISEDQSTGNQLMYVPKHKITSNINYSYKKWNSYMQTLYAGKVFTTTDKSSSLPGFTVTNIGVERKVDFISGLQITFGLKINNLFNKAYQNMAFRPMPNRNIQTQIIIKF